jgi:hypothetical protein
MEVLGILFHRVARDVISCMEVMVPCLCEAERRWNPVQKKNTGVVDGNPRQFQWCGGVGLVNCEELFFWLLNGEGVVCRWFGTPAVIHNGEELPGYTMVWFLLSMLPSLQL